MSRTVIAAVVAVVIAGLTAIAYFVTSQSFEERARKDADQALTRAYQVVQRLNQLQGIDVSNKAERLAALPEFVGAIKSSGDDRRRQAQIGFQKFMSADKEGAIKPDIIALVDDSGDMLAMHEVPSVVPKQWKNAKDESILPALNVVLRKRVIISDIWDDGKGMMKIGVAPVIDPDNVDPKNPEGVAIIGAIVVAYAQTAQNAQNDKALLGTEIVYFDGKRVVASSFTRGGSDEDTAKTRELAKILESGNVTDTASKRRISIGDTDYLIAGVRMPRKTTKELPSDYPAITAGAIVMSPIIPASNAGTVKMFILLLGGGALAIAMLGVYLAHRRLMAQVDQLEQGVTDLINGNVDRTFQPVGNELDGLANGLNVMLARLLGRPEPGEEEFDEEGNQIVPGRVEFEETEQGGAQAPAVDPDIAALAQESEPDYYKRVYTEYVAAKRASGKPDEVSFENFIAKLKVNEGKLKAQYNCRAVRFRVVTKDGKVTLKPVPIFA
ncbi:MAG TPA: MXAN_5187 C-terminal domain-containing protein [Kofleriaceae bacterium]|nr:MXAN_5187 C-terminal domain-containing protein [Kofleriaceae bacterium]